MKPGPCTLLGSPAKLSAEQWERIPAGSVLLHQAESRLWPANLEFASHAARDRWEARHADAEQAREFPELVQRESYRMLPDKRRRLPAVEAVLSSLRSSLAAANEYSDSGSRGAASAEAWASSAESLSALLRIASKESRGR